MISNCSIDRTKKSIPENFDPLRTLELLLVTEKNKSVCILCRLTLYVSDQNRVSENLIEAEESRKNLENVSLRYQREHNFKVAMLAFIYI